MASSQIRNCGQPQSLGHAQVGTRRGVGRDGAERADGPVRNLEQQGYIITSV
jgi:hypothetical protein